MCPDLQTARGQGRKVASPRRRAVTQRVQVRLGGAGNTRRHLLVPQASPGQGLEEEKMSPDISCGQKRKVREHEERMG